MGERCNNNLHVTRAGIVKFHLDDRSGNGLIGFPRPWPVQCRPTRGGHRLSHCRRAFGYATISLWIPGELRRIAGGCVERMATPRCRQRSVAPFTPALPLANPSARGRRRDALQRGVFARSRCVAAPDPQTQAKHFRSRRTVMRPTNSSSAFNQPGSSPNLDCRPRS